VRRIVITGMGCISASGHNVDEFTCNVFALENEYTTSFLPINLFNSEKLATKVAAEVKKYDASQHFNATQLKQLDRYAQFALLATEEAIIDANIEFTPALAERTCVIHGTCIGGQTTQEQAYQALYLEKRTRVHPFTVPKLIPSSATSQISMKYGITGPSFSTSSACASSGHAIAMAALMLRNNMIDVAITGGSEACINEGNFHAWEGLRVLSRDTCRPFSLNRTGLIIGEGAGTLILESLQHAQQRGAKIHAELIGIGMSSDAHNIVQPLSKGAQRAMNTALADAGSQAQDIQYINAHGSGTQQNDSSETHAIHQVFGEHAPHLSISSTKSSHGHVLGAGAAIESIATIAAITKQKVPPTRNFQMPDPECDLDYVVNHPKSTIVSEAMCNSFAFGGLNTSLIYKAY